MEPYEHKEFPKMLYSSTGANLTVHNEDELAEATADGWTESPADHGFIETVDQAEQKRRQLLKDREVRAQLARDRQLKEQQEREKADVEARARADADQKAKADPDAVAIGKKK